MSARYRRRRVRERLFREWCFLRALAVRFRAAALLVAAVLLGGTIVLRTVGWDGEGSTSWPQAAWSTWSLLFGELPADLPRAASTRVLVVAAPLVGLAVVVEALVELALLLRDRRRNERSWSEIMADSSRGHVVLVGLGRLGFRSWRLLRQLGETVVVLEKDAGSAFLEDVRRDGSAVLLGDGRNDELLRAANVASARSIVLATDDDLANLEMALDARRMNPSIRVILRLFDQNMADKVREGFGIHIAMSTSALSAPAFALPAVDASVVNGFVVDERLFVLQRWRVPAGSSLEGATAGRIVDELGFSIVRLAREGADRLYPSADVALRAGDALLVQGPWESLVALRQRARDAESFVVVPPLPTASAATALR